MKSRYFYGLIIILLLALFLRLFYYFGIMRGDDFRYAYFAYYLAQDVLETAVYYPGLNRIGLYGPAALLIKLFGTSELVLVLFPLISSLLSVVLIYKISSLLFGNRTGVVAAFIWAIFPLDIFMATQLNPEAPLAMTTAAAVYFLLRGTQTDRPWARIFHFLLSGIFLTWALNVKLSATPMVFAFGVILLYRYAASLRLLIQQAFQRARRLTQIAGLLAILLLCASAITVIARQPEKIFLNNLELTAYDIAPAWALGRGNPVGMADLGGGYWLTNREVASIPAVPNVLMAVRRFPLFDPFFPVFALALASALLLRKKAYWLPLLWLGTLFFYLEWGTFPRSFNLANLFVYLPVTHWISEDNFLYISIPMVVVIAAYLSEGIGNRSLVLPIGGAIAAVVGAAILLEQPATQMFALSGIRLALILLLVCTVLGQFQGTGSVTPGTPSKIWLALPLLMGIAALLPAGALHVWDYYKEQDRRESLRAAHQFLQTQPPLPINGAAGGPILLLDVYSGFEYGYDIMNQGYAFPATRVTNNPAVVESQGGFTIQYGCYNPVRVFEKWPIGEYGNPGDKTCVSLIRQLPVGQALSQLAEIRQQALNNPTPELLYEYLALAAESEDQDAFIEGLALFATHFPEDAPIVQASGVFTAAYHSNPDDFHPTNLLDRLVNEQPQTLKVGELVETTILREPNSHPTLQFTLARGTQEYQAISFPVDLKPSTAYLLEIELRSSATFDLVRFPRRTPISDSFGVSWQRAPAWETYYIFFVTPFWEDQSKIVDLELARILDRGEFLIRKLVLHELVPDE